MSQGRKSMLRPSYILWEEYMNEKLGVFIGGALRGEIPGKQQEIQKWSDFKRVLENAEDYFKHDYRIALSTQKTKKFMVFNPHTNKWVHFGQMGAKDFTRTLDKEKQRRYLARATNIRGNWKDDLYSPNNLAIHLLWM
jgi:hypothetical protein